MENCRALRELMDAAGAPAAAWPERYPGLRAMGYLCSYVPEEIIHAAGLAPVRIRGCSAPLRRVDAHLQSYTCALCRSTLDQALGGDLGFLEGAVFAHTCDAMQALADLWRINSSESRYVDTVMQPTNLGSPAALPYLVAELARFRDRLSAFVGQPITDDDLRCSIALFDETRRLVQALRPMRDRLSAPQFFVDLIADHGAQVVGDDLCSGSRHFLDRVGVVDEPIRALAEYYLRRPPCPTKYQPSYDPGRSLLTQFQESEAGGVIFVIEKFCEPHAFEYAMVTPTLDQAGVPHLLLEMEQTPSLEALRTRLQAFLEIL
jgi:benzoyl-CoA reductase/2-hydroxyglutaryl-CoA dehydratase subunit BcrC/BadD/HgdB